MTDSLLKLFKILHQKMPCVFDMCIDVMMADNLQQFQPRTLYKKD